MVREASINSASLYEHIDINSLTTMTGCAPSIQEVQISMKWGQQCPLQEPKSRTAILCKETSGIPRILTSNFFDSFASEHGQKVQGATKPEMMLGQFSVRQGGSFVSCQAVSSSLV